MKSIFYIAISMLAIAGDSFFTRLALATTEINHLTFSLVRIFSACLIVLMVIPANVKAPRPSNSITVLLSILFIVYISAFTYAYRELSVSMGGIVFFSVVQLCSIMFGIRYLGKRLSPFQVFGVVMTSLGAMSLLTPGITAGGSITSMSAMMIASLAWASFTITIQQQNFSIFSLRKVFTCTAVIISFPLFTSLMTNEALRSNDGYVYAVLCGAMTTGLGYSIWLLISNSVTQNSAAVAHISAPLITVYLGVTFLSETLSANFVSATVLIVFGITLFYLSEYLKSLVNEP